MFASPAKKTKEIKEPKNAEKITVKEVKKTKQTSIHSVILTTMTLITLSIFLHPQVIQAKSKCENISNKDEKTKCLEVEMEETKKKLNETTEKLSNVLSNITQLSSQLNVTQSELTNVQNNINEIKATLDEINENLADRNEKLKDKIKLRNQILRSYSKKGVLKDLELFFSKNTANLTGFEFSTYVYAFNKATNQETLSVIGALNSEIRSFEQDKKEAEDMKNKLETAQNNLVALKNNLDAKRAAAEKEQDTLEEKKEGYEEELEALQSKILDLKSGAGNGTVGDYEAPSSKTPDPPFKPAIAVFSYGAYTHYKGMSQYGAKGRAEDGQNAEKIIKFYYKAGVKEKSMPDEICVEGKGNMDFQKYLYGIAEMPSDWPDEALKAQAIAARSYAYRYAKDGKCICTSQSCQVFNSGKSNNPPSKWKKAVDATENKIIDGDVVAYYSSTTGGYIENIGWDVSGDWPNDAYEKKAGSPWFRKAWYTESYSSSNTCGHSHPWLTESEMADILNAYTVYTKGSSKEKSHISPLTTDCWDGDPYSKDEMKEKAGKYGAGYNKVTDIDISISGGYTAKVTFKTDQGSVTVDGPTFKTVFNLRAPGYVAIRSRLYDFGQEN